MQNLFGLVLENRISNTNSVAFLIHIVNAHAKVFIYNIKSTS